MIRVGVIGYGYWGPNIVRNFMEASDATVAAVCDVRAERLALAASRYPTIRTTNDYQEVLRDSTIDAIAIPTPVFTHFELAMQALKADKHVLIEKPMTATAEQALRLIEEAERRNLVLMIDHTFVYTGAVRKIHALVSDRQLGDIFYYDSVRVNLGLFQQDVNVIWDLAVHDLSIMDYVLTEKPVAVSATGMSHIPGKPENVAYLTLFFNSNQLGHIHVNWLAPVKVRRTLIGGSDRMIVYDDIEPDEKIKIYDKGVNVYQQPEAVYELLVSYRSGDMWAPKLDNTEALRTEAAHFIECIENRQCPLTDGFSGLRVVRLLEAAEQSLKARGQLVEVSLEEDS